MIIAFVENVSFHGIVGDSLPPVVLKFHPNLSQPIVIVTCKNVTISNIIFKKHGYCECRKCETSVRVMLCVSCKIRNVIFYEVGLQILNFLGTSYLEKVTLNLDNKLLYSDDGDLHGIKLSFFNPQSLFFTIDPVNVVLITDLTVSGTNNHSTDTSSIDGTALKISMGQTSFGVFVAIKNSVFTSIISQQKPMVSVILQSNTYLNQVCFAHCTFEKKNMLMIVKYEEQLFIFQCLTPIQILALWSVTFIPTECLAQYINVPFQVHLY